MASEPGRGQALAQAFAALGYKPLPEEDAKRAGSDVGYVDLSDGSRRLISTWASMSQDLKREVVDLSELELARAMAQAGVSEEMLGPAWRPSEEDVNRVQAAVTMLLEEAVAKQRRAEGRADKLRNHVILCVPEPVAGDLVVVKALKDKIHRKVELLVSFQKTCMLTVYFTCVLMDSLALGWASTAVGKALVCVLGLAWIASEGRATPWARNYALPAIFGHDAESISWKCDSFASALLLLTLTQAGSPLFGLILVLTSLPYTLGFLDEAGRACGPGHRPRALAGVRSVAIALNKALLLYLSWASWASLALVMGVFFPEMAALLAQLALSVVLSVSPLARQH